MIESLRKAANDNIPRYSLKGVNTIAIPVSVYDGDTCDVVMNIPGEGDTIKRLTLRLLGYNSPELKMPLSMPLKERLLNHEKALEARETLKQLLGCNEDPKALLRIECEDWDKYGRVLARVYKIKNENIDETDYCVNDKMLQLTASVAYNPGGK